MTIPMPTPTRPSTYIYRDRILEYHVITPILLQALDKTYPTMIPSSKLYDTVKASPLRTQPSAPTGVDYANTTGLG